ncbi:MAG TPA: hypothetical protein VMI75_00920 [Polyangiaceae bacterium]|nr:hypothetical protein [Polyangiaceae bacterium]
MCAVLGGDVEALCTPVVEQRDLERIAHTRAQVGVVGEDHGLQRAALIARGNLPHRHAVLGQGPRLVCCDDRDRPERLDGSQPPDEGVALGHPLDAQGQRQGHHRRHALWDGRHGQRHREHDDLVEPPDALGEDAEHDEQHDEAADRARDLRPEHVQPTLQRRLFARDRP